MSRTGDSWHHRMGFSKLVGSHMLKIGAEYNRVQWYYENGITSIGFANAQTADPLRLGTHRQSAGFVPAECSGRRHPPRHHRDDALVGRRGRFLLAGLLENN